MNHTKKIIASAAALSAVAPVAASAQVGGAPPSAFAPNFVSLGNIIVNQVWIFFTIIAIIMFVIAGIQFLTSMGDPDKVSKARGSFLWGIAGIAVGIIAYTIIAVVRGALGA